MDASSLIDHQFLASFCKRWKVERLDLFGSFARGEAGPDSDLDLLVTFQADAAWSLFDHVRMEDEIAERAGRKIELVSRKAIERSTNPYRQRLILGEARPFYAA